MCIKYFLKLKGNIKIFYKKKTNQIKLFAVFTLQSPRSLNKKSYVQSGFHANEHQQWKIRLCSMALKIKTHGQVPRFALDLALDAIKGTYLMRCRDYTKLRSTYSGGDWFMNLHYFCQILICMNLFWFKFYGFVCGVIQSIIKDLRTENLKNL